MRLTWPLLTYVLKLFITNSRIIHYPCEDLQLVFLQDMFLETYKLQM